MRLQDRLRPSNEQQSAQKGSKRLEMLLEAAIRYTKFPAILVVNLTGYVEELAVAVASCVFEAFFWCPRKRNTWRVFSLKGQSPFAFLQ